MDSLFHGKHLLKPNFCLPMHQDVLLKHVMETTLWCLRIQSRQTKFYQEGDWVAVTFKVVAVFARQNYY